MKGKYLNISKIYDVKENIVRFRERSIICIYVYIYLKETKGKQDVLLRTRERFVYKREGE